MYMLGKSTKLATFTEDDVYNRFYQLATRCVHRWHRALCGACAKEFA